MSLHRRSLNQGWRASFLESCQKGEWGSANRVGSLQGGANSSEDQGGVGHSGSQGGAGSSEGQGGTGHSGDHGGTGSSQGHIGLASVALTFGLATMTGDILAEGSGVATMTERVSGMRAMTGLDSGISFTGADSEISQTGMDRGKGKETLTQTSYSGSIATSGIGNAVFLGVGVVSGVDSRAEIGTEGELREDTGAGKGLILNSGAIENSGAESKDVWRG